MAKSSGQKLKLLWLKDYLTRYSDENHPVTVSDMIAFLSEKGISASAKAFMMTYPPWSSMGWKSSRSKGARQGTI